MEGETIKKKYSSILDMLKKERLTFSNQLEVEHSNPRLGPFSGLVFDLVYWASRHRQPRLIKYIHLRL